MSIEQHGKTRTPEEQKNVLLYLRSLDGPWVGTLDYEGFSRAGMKKKHTQVKRAVLAETNADPRDVEVSFSQGEQFIDRTFDLYEDKGNLSQGIGRAFVVPMRSNREDELYASESTPLIPLYDPDRFAVTSEIRMRGIVGMPPAILDTYTKSPYDSERGALVLAPIYDDMRRDLWPDRANMDQQIEFLRIGKRALEDTMRFAHVQLGAKVIGLGAILPGLTHFGQMLHSMDGMRDAITTTGHGGTVYMIAETARKIMQETSIQSHGRIGIIGGAGSIGWSTTTMVSEMMPDHHIVSFDVNKEGIYGRIGGSDIKDSITVAPDIAGVLRSTNIILTAVTSQIDLNNPQFEGLDLTGKVIIDDSQPGAFDVGQVEARGGKLIWVVGEDGTENSFITRDGYHTDGVPYNYGDHSGLWGHASEFACGQEAAVIAQSKEYDKAIQDRVSPKDAALIGGLFRAVGVRVAPFQAFGKPVDIE